MQKENYSAELQIIIDDMVSRRERKSLLLHACCAPCSSYVLEYLAEFFDIALLFYNPNIAPFEEYEKRKSELIRLVDELPLKIKPQIIDCDYEGELFKEMSTGLEDAPEGGNRCFKCYELRLRKAAEIAKEKGYDYFTSTLSISPLKSAEKLNEIGNNLSLEYKVPHLPSDFKKKGGYQRSIVLSKEHQLYRQNYCGCIYSRESSEKRALDSQKDIPKEPDA